MENGFKDCRVDIGILTDDTGSITEIMWDSMIEFIKNLAQFVEISQNGPHIGLTTYGFNRAEVIIKLNEHTDYHSFEQALDSITRTKTPGNDLALGINVTLNKLFNVAHGARNDVPKAIILLTDGDCDFCLTTEDPATAKKLELLAKKMHKDKVKMLVIGVGNAGKTATYEDMKFHIEQFVNRSSFHAIEDHTGLLDQTLLKKLTPVCDGMYFVFSPSLKYLNNFRIYLTSRLKVNRLFFIFRQLIS